MPNGSGIQGLLISFIGGGNKGGAFIRALLAIDQPPFTIAVRDPDPARQAEWGAEGLRVLGEQELVWEEALVIVLAVKPQLLEEVCRQLRPLLQKRLSSRRHGRQPPLPNKLQPLVISLSTGVPMARLRDWLGDVLIVRAMPTRPADERGGIVALWADSPRDCPTLWRRYESPAEIMLSVMGPCVWLDTEEEFHAVAALSESCPANFFLLTEAMQEAAEQMGLEPELARRLIRQTARGAAALAEEGEDSPAQWRQKVTSPGGTTAAALQEMEQGQVREWLRRGVLAAARQLNEEL